MTITVQSTDEKKVLPPMDARKKGLLSDPERFALIGVWLILIAFFVIKVPETFPTMANVSNMLGSQAVLLVLALGLIIPLRANIYDLSMASVMTLSAVIVASFYVMHGWSLWACVLLALAVGLLIGAINGLIVTKFEIDPFIITLGIGTVVLGVSYIISESRTVSGVDPFLSEVMLSKPFLGIPLDFWYAVTLCAVVWFVFEYTAFGQRLLFIGQNPDVARLNGVNVPKLRWISLICSGGIGALAGVVFVGTTLSADNTSGGAFLLPAFAAAFLGSTTIRVGRFNPWGTLIAVYFLVTGITGLQLMGAQQYVQQLFYGGALVIAVVASKIVRARSQKRRLVVQKQQ